MTDPDDDWGKARQRGCLFLIVYMVLVIVIGIVLIVKYLET